MLPGRVSPLDNAIRQVQARTAYGVRPETALDQGWVFNFSNASRTWDRWRTSRGKIKKGEVVDLDANEIIIYAPARKAEEIARQLPILPLYSLSTEAGGATPEQLYEAWFPKDMSNNPGPKEKWIHGKESGSKGYPGPAHSPGDTTGVTEAAGNPQEPWLMKSVYYGDPNIPEAFAEIAKMKEKGVYFILNLNVPFYARRKGLATKIMEQIVRDADKKGVTLLGDIQPDDSGPGYGTLKEFYKRYGFSEVRSGRDKGLIRRKPQKDIRDNPVYAEDRWWSDDELAREAMLLGYKPDDAARIVKALSLQFRASGHVLDPVAVIIDTAERLGLQPEIVQMADIIASVTEHIRFAMKYDIGWMAEMYLGLLEDERKYRLREGKGLEVLPRLDYAISNIRKIIEDRWPEKARS
jgi:hypothetical protein